MGICDVTNSQTDRYLSIVRGSYGVLLPQMGVVKFNRQLNGDLASILLISSKRLPPVAKLWNVKLSHMPTILKPLGLKDMSRSTGVSADICFMYSP